jgi:hypothetical protein
MRAPTRLVVVGDIVAYHEESALHYTVTEVHSDGTVDLGLCPPYPRGRREHETIWDHQPATRCVLLPTFGGVLRLITGPGHEA